MPTLILLRHGQSTYNAEGRFTGTTDVPLTELGKQQSLEAAKTLATANINHVFTSERIRAIETFQIISGSLKIPIIPIVAKGLNEQDFGDLEGVRKEDADKIYSPEKILEWRRAFHSAPPQGEKFIAVQIRVAEFYNKSVLPKLKEGKNVLLVAHGNSLRALAIFLLNISLHEIANFELGNSEPFFIKIGTDGIPYKTDSSL